MLDNLYQHIIRVHGLNQTDSQSSDTHILFVILSSQVYNTHSRCYRCHLAMLRMTRLCVKKVKKVNFEIYIADRKANTCI